MTGRRAHNQQARQAFHTARQHGLRRRHTAKLAHLAERSQGSGDAGTYDCSRCPAQLRLDELLPHIEGHVRMSAEGSGDQ